MAAVLYANFSFRDNQDQLAMFIRVKRQKLTYFLHCDPTDTILEIKQKIQALSDTPADCQRLILLSSHQILEDNKTLADQKVENDAIVALCFKISDPRVHRIPTIMRKPLPDVPKESPEEKPVEQAPSPEVPTGDESNVVPPPESPPEHRMSTELRVPYKPPPPTAEELEKMTKEELEKVKKEKARLLLLKLEEHAQSKADANKNSKKGLEKKTGKESPKKGSKEVSKGGKGTSKGGKETKGGKESTKKGGKKTEKEETVPQPEQAVIPEEETGVWENITIDKLSNYANLIDSD